MMDLGMLAEQKSSVCVQSASEVVKRCMYHHRKYTRSPQHQFASRYVCHACHAFHFREGRCYPNFGETRMMIPRDQTQGETCLHLGSSDLAAFGQGVLWNFRECWTLCFFLFARSCTLELSTEEFWKSRTSEIRWSVREHGLVHGIQSWLLTLHFQL